AGEHRWVGDGRSVDVAGALDEGRAPGGRHVAVEARAAHVADVARADGDAAARLAADRAGRDRCAAARDEAPPRVDRDVARLRAALAGRGDLAPNDRDEGVRAALDLDLARALAVHRVDRDLPVVAHLEALRDVHADHPRGAGVHAAEVGLREEARE